jgi:divalent metal cation (Fe/Co/Zn/Cd) transporter
MKKYIPEILMTLLLALLVGSFILRSEALDRVIDYVGGVALFFAFVAAADQLAKWLGRGYYFAMVSVICFFVIAGHIFLA